MVLYCLLIIYTEVTCFLVSSCFLLLFGQVWGIINTWLGLGKHGLGSNRPFYKVKLIRYIFLRMYFSSTESHHSNVIGQLQKLQ